MSFIRYSFGYNVYDLHDEEGYLNLNIYKIVNKVMIGIQMNQLNMYDTKVTALFNVSKREYDGGEFEIFKSNVMPVINLKDDFSMVMFKSFKSRSKNRVNKLIYYVCTN